MCYEIYIQGKPLQSQNLGEKIVEGRRDEEKNFPGEVKTEKPNILEEVKIVPIWLKCREE